MGHWTCFAREFQTWCWSTIWESLVSTNAVFQTGGCGSNFDASTLEHVCLNPLLRTFARKHGQFCVCVCVCVWAGGLAPKKKWPNFVWKLILDVEPSAKKVSWKVTSKRTKVRLPLSWVTFADALDEIYPETWTSGEFLWLFLMVALICWDWNPKLSRQNFWLVGRVFGTMTLNGILLLLLYATATLCYCYFMLLLLYAINVIYKYI